MSKIILLQESAHPFHPKTLRASAATALKAPLFYGPSLHELAAMSQNSSFFTLDKSRQNIFKFQWPQHLHLLVGEEGQGLPFTSKNALAIPLANQVESLNAVAAVSVALSCRQVQI